MYRGNDEGMTISIERVIQAHDQLGETPLWCPRTGRVWWIDIEKPKLQSLDEATGRHEVYSFPSTFLGSVALHRAGGFLIALDNALHRFEPPGTLEHLVDVEAPDAGTRLNDGRCDVRGRLWIGTMDAAIERPLGSFYRVDPDGTVRRFFGDVIVTNSVAVSPDQRTLYMSDTRRFVLWAFDLDAADGVISNRRVFVDYSGTSGRPDGACVDAEGCVWNAVFAGHRVVRYTPAGAVERVIELPVTHPTCVCFGGPDLDRLYVTTARKMLAPEVLAREELAGALLACRPGVKGLPEPLFG